MLDINKISHTGAFDEAWKKEKRGKFSASLFGKLFGKKFDSAKGDFGQTAITYIESMAGEKVTGQPAKHEFSNVYTDSGNAMEQEAIKYFCKVMNKEVLRPAGRFDSHTLIHHDDYCCCTPDALICMAPKERLFTENGLEVKVAPLETKCPPVLHRFIKLYKCKTPKMLKDTEWDYYWQVIFQMICTGSLIGYFAAYNPHFPNPMRIIEFKKMELAEDFKLANATLHHAKKLYDKTIEELKTL